MLYNMQPLLYAQVISPLLADKQTGNPVALWKHMSAANLKVHLQSLCSNDTAAARSQS